jgi:tyrosinase
MLARSAADHTDPLGWTFQAMIHGIITRQPKQDAIELFYENKPPTARQLAESTWATCPHTADLNDIRLDFLPWHRIYLYYFERIARKASGDASFTLPFWDYSDTAMRAIPLAFREQADGSLWANALYNPRRDPRLNDPYDAAPLALTEAWHDALEEDGFEAAFDSSGGLIRLGFSLALEIDPHGPIHTLTSGADEAGGVNGDMGDTSTAGRDPIFWVHHCAIDWFWARWLQANNLGADWMKLQPWAQVTWDFVDEDGDPVSWTFADFLTQVSDNPGYDLVAGGQQVAASEAAPQPDASALSAQPALAARSAGGVPLSGQPVSVEVSRLAGVSPAMMADGKLALRVSAVAERATGVVFDVYLNLDDPAAIDESRRVGSISFFGAGQHAHAAGGARRQYVFDVTRVVAQLTEVGAWAGDPRVTFVPSATFSGSPARVENVELLRLP